LGQEYITPTCLYNRAWGNWAELQVWGYDDCIVWEGEINGRWRSGSFDANLAEEMGALEFPLHQRQQFSRLERRQRAGCVVLYVSSDQVLRAGLHCVHHLGGALEVGVVMGPARGRRGSGDPL